jgi:hypothetical protein
MDDQALLELVQQQGASMPMICGLKAPGAPSLFRPRGSSKSRLMLGCTLGCTLYSGLGSADFAYCVATLHEFPPASFRMSVLRYGACGALLPFFFLSTGSLDLNELLWQVCPDNYFFTYSAATLLTTPCFAAYHSTL